MSNLGHSQAEIPIEKQRSPDSPIAAPYEVLCICFGVGFPNGSATTPRIVLVGKALLLAGMGFRVFHCGPSPLEINTQKSGVFEGIPFEYGSPVRRPANLIVQKLMYVWSLLALSVRLVRLRAARHRTVIWLYILTGPANLYIGWLCRLLGIPVVQELCEWFPGDPTCSAFTKWLYRKPIFKNATGILVISRLIEQRVRDLSARINLDLRIHRLPSIVDPQRFAANSAASDLSLQTTGWFVWCGGESWIKDILFLVRAAAVARLKGCRIRVKIIGDFKESSRRLVAQEAANAGVPSEDILFTGYVDNRTLEESYRTAAALLLPLRDDDRSKTRLPNKLGEYLASGRPIVTCKVGDLTDFLAHRVNVYLAAPGDEQDFAEQIISVIQDPAAASRIGAAGQKTCMDVLDYRAHATALAQFFTECCRCARKDEATLTNMHGFDSVSRNAACGILASLLIAGGVARRAKRRLLNANSITSVYFHNPKRSLFERCVSWLAGQGYTFISAEELMQILQGERACPRRAVWLSLDDGYKQWMDEVLPVVCAHRVPVTFFIPVGLVEGDGLFPWLHDRDYPLREPRGRISSPKTGGNRETITVEQLRRIARYPEVTIGAHTVNHIIMNRCTDDQLRREIVDCKSRLESLTGSRVDSFAYPAGQYDSRGPRYLRKYGFRLAATTEASFVSPNTDSFVVPRICVPDDVTFPEAICRMLGIWRPFLDPIKAVLHLEKLSSVSPAA